MNSFSINRLGKMLRWVLSVNFRLLLMWSIGYTVVIFLGEQLFFAFSIDHDAAAVLDNISQFCTISILITLVAGLSTVFYGLNKKTNREAFLMLPASNLEKFLAAVMYVTFILTFCVALSFVIGDTLRMAYRALMDGDEWLSTVPMVAHAIQPGFLETFSHAPSFEYVVMNIIVLCATCVWVHSLYILGGTLFRKYSFVASSIVLILTMWCLGWLVSHCGLTMFSKSRKGDYYWYVGTLPYVLVVMQTLLSVFNYWFSYRIFKGMQLITNKWTNYDFYKR